MPEHTVSVTSPAPTVLRMGYYLAEPFVATTKFYQQALGLELRFEDAARWAEFQAGGARFALSCAQESPHHQEGAMLVFECADIDALSASVVQHGGTILHQRDMGSHGRFVTVSDPAGNRFQLFMKGRGAADASAQA